jgi:galactokinase
MIQELERQALALFHRAFAPPGSPKAAAAAFRPEAAASPRGGVAGKRSWGAGEDGAHPTGAVCVVAPGRVNLIGEHTDYNEGFVMPLALEKATVCVARLNADERDSRCRITSTVAGAGVREFSLSAEALVPGDESWAKYVQGVVAQYAGELLPVGSTPARGFEAAFASDVPLGGGLSSSASLEVCTAQMLEALYGVRGVSAVDRALRCVEAEHAFAKVPCGIMDQFISSCGVQGCALLIDCRSRATTKVNLSDPGLKIVVCNSNVKHTLSGSEYPDRVRQCREAAQAAAKRFDSAAAGKESKKRTHLRDVSLAELEELRAAGDISEMVHRRARHGVSEDARTLEALQAAKAKDYVRLGQLMVQSHNSLRDDYEVSIPEIDFLVQTACQQPGVYGSRITGGGFGGCTVSLVEAGKAEALMVALDKAFTDKFPGQKCTCFATSIGAGARVLWHDKPNKKAKSPTPPPRAKSERLRKQSPAAS